MGGTMLRQISLITQNYGVLGLGIGMFFESLGIPFASAIVALTAGTLIASGKTSFLAALLISTGGLVLGSLVSYYVGYLGGRLGRLLNTNQCRQIKKDNLFTERYKRWGEMTILVAQLFGTTRTWISLPAGAMKMRVQKFVAYTAIGGAIYCALAIGFSVALASLLSRLLSMLNSEVYLILLLMSLVAAGVSTAVYIFRNKKRCPGEKK